MGDIKFISFALVMASAILFSSVLGIFLGEWKGTCRRTRSLLGVGLVLLLAAAVIGSVSGKLKEDSKKDVSSTAKTN